MLQPCCRTCKVLRRRRRKPSRNCSATGTRTRMLIGCKFVQQSFSSSKRPDIFSRVDSSHSRCRSLPLKQWFYKKGRLATGKLKKDVLRFSKARFWRQDLIALEHWCSCQQCNVKADSPRTHWTHGSEDHWSTEKVLGSLRDHHRFLGDDTRYPREGVLFLMQNASVGILDGFGVLASSSLCFIAVCAVGLREPSWWLGTLCDGTRAWTAARIAGFEEAQTRGA